MADVAWRKSLCLRQSEMDGLHLDEQRRESFATELLVHTEEIDLHHALGVASYTDGSRHSCTARNALFHACQQMLPTLARG